MLLSVIIPAYNEKNTINALLKKVDAVDLHYFGFEKEIIIVDDYSKDGTREILKSLENRYKIVYHEKNKGKGAAIRTGLLSAKGDFVIIQDADLEYDPQEYGKLLKCALDNKADVVYGSRRLNDKNTYSHISYYLGGGLLSWATNILYRTHITDEATCYKLFKTDLIKSFDLKCERFEFCPEVTAKTAKRGIKIYEVPISYYPRPVSEGKKIKWRDGLAALWALLKYKFVD